MAEATTRVGFIGLGAMGSRMAANVLRAGYPLTVYNRTRERTRELAARGAAVGESPRDVAARSDVVITMLSTPEAVRAVLDGPDGVLAGARDGATLIDMSTVGPSDARAVADQATARGIRVLNAPVLGSIGPAEKGELIVLVGGNGDVAEQHRALLETMGKTVRYLGAHESACALKLAVNALMIGSLQLCGEVVAMATRWGLARDEVLDLLSPTVSPAVKGRLGTMYQAGAPAAFPLRLGRKDLWLTAVAGYEKEASLPLVAAALETATMALRDHADEDIGRIAAFVDEMSAPGAGA